MLQQILKDMYIEPELLEELSDDQKQILFLKMREEQIRRWKEIEKKEEQQENNNSDRKTTRKANQRRVHFTLDCDDEDGPIAVLIIPDHEAENEEERNRREEEEALRQAEELAKKEAEERKRKQKEELEAKRLEEERRIREEEERLRKEALEREERLKEVEERLKREAEERETELRRREEERRRLEEEERIRKQKEEERRTEEEKRSRKLALEKEEKERKVRQEKIERERQEEFKREEERLKREAEEKEEMVRKEKEQKQKEEEELKRKREQEEMYQKVKEAKLRAQKAEEERKALEKRMKEMEEKRQQQLEELRQKEEDEKRKREEEIAEMEKKRKQELYESMKRIKEENRRREEQEMKELEESWLAREQKAREAERDRKNSFNQAKHEMKRLAKIAKEKTVKVAKSASLKFGNEDKLTFNASFDKESPTKDPNTSSAQSPKPRTSFSDKFNTLKGSLTKSKQSASPQRPPLPKKLEISGPVPIKPIADNQKTLPIKRQISKPTRPPPPAASNVASQNTADGKPERPTRARRPADRDAVAQWWREVEYEKGSGFNEEGDFLEWFHGIISRDQSEKLLSEKEKGAFLVRVSERIWGYTVSYKDDNKCKHFLVDTSGNTYQFFGTQQIPHRTLKDLIDFHSERPISGVGQEYLKYPCGQLEDTPDYQDLLIESTSM